MAALVTDTPIIGKSALLKLAITVPGGLSPEVFPFYMQVIEIGGTMLVSFAKIETVPKGFEALDVLSVRHWTDKTFSLGLNLLLMFFHALTVLSIMSVLRFLLSSRYTHQCLMSKT